MLASEHLRGLILKMYERYWNVNSVRLQDSTLLAVVEQFALVTQC
jgi:hypothetical protein